MNKTKKDWLVYFDVPFSEQDDVFKLGAKYNKYLDKYYYQGEPSKFILFSKWILGDRSDISIIGNIYILESKRTCWKCQKETTIIGLGIDEHVNLYHDENTNQISMTTSLYDNHTKIHLAWVNDEQDIPSTLLRYLKMHYPVRTGHSSIAGESFANHCEHCGSIQGNNYIFSEIDSPLMLDASEKTENLNKLSNIKIKSVCCGVNLCVNWNIQISSTDDLYAKACPQEKTYIWNYGLDCLYEEMYNIPIINYEKSKETVPKEDHIPELTLKNTKESVWRKLNRLFK